MSLLKYKLLWLHFGQPLENNRAALFPSSGHTVCVCGGVSREREREGDRGRWVSVLGERKNVLESVRVYVWVGDWREKERKRKKET